MAAASADAGRSRDSGPGPEAPTTRRRVATIVGARPQFVKAAALSPALAGAGLDEALVHTGQHYDREMSRVFFDGLALPEPAIELGIGSGTHGDQTGRMLVALESALVELRPALAVVFGDTNSTLAGALAAAKLGIPVAHVEAGLRSFDRAMPEEINRVATDHVSDLLFAPTATAVARLTAEGLAARTVFAGDPMLDVVRAQAGAIAVEKDAVLRELAPPVADFALATVHRAANTDDAARWRSIVAALARVGKELPVLWLAHPRTRARLAELALPGVRVAEPQSYLRTQALVAAARVVVTDSGGLQKEAAFHATPCVVLRERSEWEELVDSGAAVLAGADPERIVAAVRGASWPAAGLSGEPFGDGRSAVRIARHLADLPAVRAGDGSGVLRESPADRGLAATAASSRSGP